MSKERLKIQMGGQEMEIVSMMLTLVSADGSRSILILDFSVPPRPLRNDQNQLQRKCYSQLSSLVGRDDGCEARRLVEKPDRLPDTLDLALGRPD